MVFYLAQLKVHYFVLRYLPNLDKSLVLKKVYDLVYISELFQEYLKVPCLALHKKTRRGICLD